MNLGDLKEIIVLLVLIALIGAAVAIALADFQTETTTDSAAYNATGNGLAGVDNATEYLDTTGTIAGVAVLIGIVILAFGVMARR